MKKLIKFAAVSLAAAMMVLSFCSCKQLDEAKKSQAFWSGKKGEAIVYGGEKYVKLPKCEILSAQGKDITVTDKDVPVLLSNMYGDRFIYDSKHGIMSPKGDGDIFYVSADKYDEVTARIKERKLDKYCVRTVDDMDERWYVVDDSVIEAINAAIGSAQAADFSEEYLINAVYDLEKCDKDILLADPGDFVDIYCYEIDGKAFYTVDYKGESEYLIPEQYNKTVDGFIQKESPQYMIGAKDSATDIEVMDN